MTKLPLIRVGDRTFLGDGAAAFGAVRTVAPGGHAALIVHIEGYGEATVPLDAVEKVVAGRVVMRYDALAEDLQRAVKHTQDREDFPPRDEGEVELVPAPDGDDSAAAAEGEGEGGDEDADADDRALYAEPPDSAPDELPGRAEGARYGTPPSLAGVRNRSDRR